MSKAVLNSWKKGFAEADLSSDVSKIYLAYITRLIHNNVPIIMDFTHLSKLLGRTPVYLATLINSNTSFYRDFVVAKRSGGERTITAPHASLKECQDWVYKNILSKIKVHPVAQGYVKKKSIITNAKLHVGQENFLKLDLQDFFPSIPLAWVMSIFKGLGYTNRVSFYLASICTYGGHLPQGAPSSPIISNIVCYRLDRRLFELAKKWDLKYSRYADDLAFSGHHISLKFLNIITDIINSEGFEVNSEKTFISKNKGKRILTGVSIASDVIKLPRSYKKDLRTVLFYIDKFGYMSHVKKKKIRQPGYLVRLIGKVNYWLSIEPDNSEAKKYLIMLKRIADS